MWRCFVGMPIDRQCHTDVVSHVLLSSMIVASSFAPVHDVLLCPLRYRVRYPMQHAFHPRESAAVKAFVMKCFSIDAK